MPNWHCQYFVLLFNKWNWKSFLFFLFWRAINGFHCNCKKKENKTTQWYNETTFWKELKESLTITDSITTSSVIIFACFFPSGSQKICAFLTIKAISLRLRITDMQMLFEEYTQHRFWPIASTWNTYWNFSGPKRTIFRNPPLMLV